MFDYSVTFACYNQVDFTRQCLDSMVRAGDDLSRVVVVDNGSSDDTLLCLGDYPIGSVIRNSSNLGCGVAWNQGALELQSEWTIIMNNDVLVSPGWIDGLINGAIRHGLSVASPAMIEGEEDYGFFDFSAQSVDVTYNFLRLHLKHAVCVAVHWSVFEKVGFFAPVPSLLGYEDTMFFTACDMVGIRSGTVGSSWIHHFGSITQSAMKRERGLSAAASLGSRDNKSLLGLSWIRRKAIKFRKGRLTSAYRLHELSSAGLTLHGTRVQGSFCWA